MLYVVRHGQTEWNIEKRFQGQLDSPLSELGARQAKAAATYLTGVQAERLYASPLGRAWKTAAVISKAIGCERHTEDRLMECSFGICEGMTLAEIENAFPGKPAWRDADKWNRRYDKAESYRQVFERVGIFAESALRPALEPGGPVICTVAHDLVDRCLVGYLSNWEQARIMTDRQGNDEIFLLSHKGTERLKLQEV